MTSLPPRPPPAEASSELSAVLRQSWHRFLDTYEPLRPELYRYCRQLTRSPWDADDLVQDVLSRAFVTLGSMDQAPPNPRAWLFRVASNLWIDRVRRAREVPAVHSEAPQTQSAEPRAAREAAGTLIGQLSPQERVAMVLKDVFELSLEEVATAIGTSVGAVKSALHGARSKLKEPDPPEPSAPDTSVLDAFCAAFNARDLDRLTELLLDTASVEVVRITTQYGRDRARRTVLPGMLFGSRRLAEAHLEGGIDPRYQAGVRATLPRGEVCQHRGEALLLSWYEHEDGEAVRAITRLESDGVSVVRLRNYFYTPDVLAEICAELGVPFRANGYRPWYPSDLLG
jgi:RNA polymerase sigma-70 factor (ECF subfamily)